MYNAKEIEKEVQEYWKKNKIPEKIVEFNLKSKKPKFFLLDGPPYANAQPHVGHAMTTIFKDLWSKLKIMQGYQVWLQPGFDCHGLPVENKVEKEIGVKSKKDIENFGVSKFIQKCREFSTKNLNEWMKFYRDIGAWRGWKNPYLTYENYYIESGWWTIKKLYEKGLLVQGKKPIHWCPSCQTSLSGYEVTDSYKDVKDPSIYIKFPVKGEENTYFLVWTTTPWTLPANVALVVHPEETYVKILVRTEKLILAKKLLEAVAQKTDIEYKVLEEFKGKKLVGMKYKPVLDVPIQKKLDKEKNAHIVVASIQILKKNIASKVAEKKGISTKVDGENFGHFVTMDIGTGIVHCAPGHGSEDNKLGEHYKLPVISPVNEEGKLENGTGFDGLFVKDADPKILEYLKKKNLLFFSEEIIHSYPLCWRCKTPLIYRLSNQWFLLTDKIKNKMVAENEKVNWLPESAKERMNNWLKNAVDWCVSIQRYWGIPFPIWICEKCGKIKVIGSKAELEKLMSNHVNLNDLHKDTVDKVELKCECGGTMKRIPDLLNIWVESGISPWASLGYPHKNKDLFNKLWPVDLIDESQDQIRGWFYSLLYMSISTFNQKPYNTVCLNGWTLDEKGEKMSKSLGNVVLAKEAYKELGADILRLYICHDVTPWETHRFSLTDAKKLFRIFNILINLEKFINMYNIEFEKNIEVRTLENRWILSKLNSLIKEVTEDFENFRFHYVARKLVNFLLNDFSRTYMKLAKENVKDKETRYVLGVVLRTYLKLLAPISPFITEKLYLALFKEYEKCDSIHLCPFPKPNQKLIDKKLEKDFEIVQEIIESVYSLRQEHKIKLRWPISKIILSGTFEVQEIVKNFKEILKQFCNAKEILFEKEMDVSYQIKPNYKLLGSRYGNKVKKIVELLLKENPNKLKMQFDKGNVILGGKENYEISKEMVVFKKIVLEGKASKSFSKGIVIIDPKLNEVLKEEAFVRELIRKIQVERKTAGLDVHRKIILYLNGPEFLRNWENLIKSEVVVSKIIFGKVSDLNKKNMKFKNQSAEFSFKKS